MIWVIVEERTDKGEPLETHHLRLSGPAVTVAEHAKAFEAWVKSLN